MRFKAGDKISYYPIITGILVNIIITTSAIFMCFKSGITSIVDTSILILLLLILLKRFTIKNIVIGEIAARASISSAVQIATYYAAILAFGKGQVLNEGKNIFILALAASTAGIIFFHNISGVFINEKYTFPLVITKADFFRSITNKKRDYKIVYSLIITTIYSALVNIFKKLPKKINLFNKVLVFQNSPLLIAMGYIIGYKNYMLMGAGFIYSLIIYIIFDRGGDFASHLINPYIYSIIISFTVTQGIISVFKLCLQFYKTRRINRISTSKENQIHKFIEYLVKSKQPFYKSNFIIITAFMLFNMFFFSGILNINHKIYPWIFLILIPLTIFSGISTVRGVAETGFWFSALEDLLPIIIILLTLNKNLTTIVLIVTSLMIFEMSGIYFIINSKLSREFNISSKETAVYSIISNIFGFSVSIALVSSQLSRLGTNEMPIPLSRILAMTIKGLADSLSNNLLPGYINIYIIAAGALICVLLNLFDISAMLVIGGIMLPFGSYLSMLPGAVMNFYLRKRSKEYRTVFSGMATADGLISAISSIIR